MGLDDEDEAAAAGTLEVNAGDACRESRLPCALFKAARRRASISTVLASSSSVVEREFIVLTTVDVSKVVFDMTGWVVGNDGSGDCRDDKRGAGLALITDEADPIGRYFYMGANR